MPQLNTVVLYDAVVVSVLFIVGYVCFLHSLLPMVSFFAKLNNYLMFCLLREICAEANIYKLKKQICFSVQYCNAYVSAAHSSYHAASALNTIFYGVYAREVLSVMDKKADRHSNDNVNAGDELYFTYHIVHVDAPYYP